MKTKDTNVRFNIVDALIIVFLTALLALIVYVFILDNDFADLYSQEKNVTYTVCVSTTDKDYKDKVSINDTVYHWNKGTNTGKVTDVRIEEWSDKTGADVYITISTVARKINTKYYINGKKIEQDALINISFARFDVSNSVKCVTFKAE